MITAQYNWLQLIRLAAILKVWLCHSSITHLTSHVAWKDETCAILRLAPKHLSESPLLHQEWCKIDQDECAAAYLDYPPNCWCHKRRPFDPQNNPCVKIKSHSVTVQLSPLGPIYTQRNVCCNSCRFSQRPENLSWHQWLFFYVKMFLTQTQIFEEGLKGCIPHLIRPWSNNALAPWCVLSGICDMSNICQQEVDKLSAWS